MAITASLVKELRERTGAGMMECKKALVETDGDVELAIENMRKSGQAKAAKKAGRVAAEGLIVARTSDDNQRAVLVEINSETDFVARDESFLGFTDAVANVALANNVGELSELLEAKLEDGTSVEEARANLVAKIGENITVRRVEKVVADSGVVATYIHGGRIGVAVATTGDNSELARDVAMHVAASNPQVATPDQVSQDALEKEKEIFTAQALESGKPADIVEKMVVGRIKKFVNEISLTGQPFVKDPSTSVGDLLKNNGAEVNSFVRYEVGEGIEKKSDDFAAEVMSQMKG